MPYSLTWNSQEMPPPKKEGGIQVETVPLVAARRTLSGKMRTDLVALKDRIVLSWALLTADQRSTIRSQYELGGSATLVLPDGRSRTVVAVAHSWKEDIIYGLSGSPRYNISITFEEE